MYSRRSRIHKQPPEGCQEKIPPEKSHLYGVRDRVRVRLEIWLGLGSGGFFPGGFFPRTAGGVLKNFANFTWKHLSWSLFFKKLQAFRPATLLKRDSYTGAFLWNLRNSEEHLFRKTSERLLLCIDYFIIYWFLQYTFFIFANKFFFMTQLKQ